MHKALYSSDDRDNVFRKEWLKGLYSIEDCPDQHKVSRRILKREKKDELLQPVTAMIRGSLNKFPDFFHWDAFIDSTNMKL